jgi:hypothetical protein
MLSFVSGCILATDTKTVEESAFISVSLHLDAVGTTDAAVGRSWRQL